MLVLFPHHSFCLVPTDRRSRAFVLRHHNTVPYFFLLAPSPQSDTNPNKPPKVFVYWVHTYILCFVQRATRVLHLHIRASPSAPVPFSPWFSSEPSHQRTSEKAFSHTHLHNYIHTYTFIEGKLHTSTALLGRHRLIYHPSVWESLPSPFFAILESRTPTRAVTRAI